VSSKIFIEIKREKTNSANVRRRPNQEMPNQILDSQASSKYCDRIINQIEHKNVFADDENWLG
jgi:hypothetical protein